MLKILWSTIAILSVAHMLALLALIGYLAGTDRLDRDRVDEVHGIFVQTISQVQQEEKAAEEEAQVIADQEAWLAQLDEANMGVEQRLVRLQKQEELLKQKLARAEKDRKYLENQVMSGLKEVEKSRTALAEERATFEAEIKRQQDLMNDEQFQKMIDIMKGMAPEQLKGELDVYIQQGEMDRVVDIINAFDKRTATKLFAQYTTPEDRVLAADLLVRLKERGQYASGGAGGSDAAPGDG